MKTGAKLLLAGTITDLLVVPIVTTAVVETVAVMEMERLNCAPLVSV